MAYLGTLMLFFADAAAPAAPAQPQEPFFMNLLLPMGILFLFYFILWRPMQGQERTRKALLGSLKKNDRVLTNAGMYGTVVGIHETEDEMTLKVDDNTRIRFTKTSVSRNFTNEEEALAKTKTKASS
ncbi:MAG: preprotein translocase subunit YajC [Gemmataceae bacterium]|nr:preprotein translocase subunit YajC [Gemmataceae bacterium]